MKRKCTSASQIKSSKIKHFQEPRVNIVDLSDCTLLHVLQFLDATSLYQLGETCTRFQYLVQDKSLWIHVDGRSQPNNADKLAFCWQNIHKKTQHILLAGSQRSEVVLSLEILIGPEKLNHLTVLALEHQFIKYCRLEQFPKTIEELSFKHSYIANHDQFFSCSPVYVPNLKTLILDHCQWFGGSSLQDIVNIPKLEILSLYMCKKVVDNHIRHINRWWTPIISTSLRVVDLRFTGVGDSFIEKLYKYPSIQIIYFQCFATTYRLERYKRKLDIIRGAVINEHSYVSDDEANNDTSRDSFYKRFQASKLEKYNWYTIKDDSMVVFTRLKKVGSSRTRPESYLYSYPYEDCTCGFFNKSSETCGFVDFAKQAQDTDDDISENVSTCSNEYLFKQSKKGSSSSSSETSEDENEWDPKHLLQKLKHERKRQKINRNRRQGGEVYFMTLDMGIADNCCTLPDRCQVQASPSPGTQKWRHEREPRNDYEIAMVEHNEESVERAYYGGCRFAGYAIKNASCMYLIKKTSECIQRLKTNQCPENEAMTVVNEFLIALDECLKNEEFFKFFDDIDFIRQLCISFCQLSQNVKHNIYYVLNYHFTYFDDLLQQLSWKSSSGGAKKSLLKCFFNNLLLSESCVPIFKQDYINLQKIREVKALPETTDDNLNMPGPSSLQSSKMRKKFKQKHCSKTKRAKIGVGHSECSNNSDINNTEQPQVSLDMMVNVLAPQSERDTPTYIKELSFRGFPHITDLTLTHLRELELELLDVTGTNVTQFGVQQFMLYNPQCRLIHETACVCPPKLHF